MIRSAERPAAPAPILGAVLLQCSGLLLPKLRRLLNPNVVDAGIRLQLHFQAGVLNHLREHDAEPAYVADLLECGSHGDAVQEILKLCLRTIAKRLDGRLDAALHGVLTLNVAISGGQATISSEVDWVRRPSAAK